MLLYITVHFISMSLYRFLFFFNPLCMDHFSVRLVSIFISCKKNNFLSHDFVDPICMWASKLDDPLVEHDTLLALGLFRW
jgi:hypothetical protein